ncbi:hypothetical protein DASC09_059290 [Saccharomycopsis crataegensis]|uniref:Uncharacterized protein n=1 Tax=Saccharomycopsis crataegensis TaxID=43959 RepID=A0AAV5QUE6_9ASCO|nr:hypothetical protein DASC09_059290 [Saccharomycopsis crataegensis]
MLGEFSQFSKIGSDCEERLLWYASSYEDKDTLPLYYRLEKINSLVERPSFCWFPNVISQSILGLLDYLREPENNHRTLVI